MPILSDVVVILLSSIVVLTPNGQFLECVTVAFNERYNLNICIGSFVRNWYLEVMFNVKRVSMFILHVLTKLDITIQMN
jgi:hypothetical protein